MGILYPNPSESNPSVKRCSKCKCEFPATTEFFYERKGTKDGLNGQCKECIKQRVNTRYHQPEIREQRLTYRSRPEIREREREWQREYYSRPDIKRKHREYERERYYRPDVREKVLEYSRRPEVRARHREDGRKRTSNPLVRAKIYEQQREYRSRPEIKAKRAAYGQVYQQQYINTAWGREKKRTHDRVRYRRIQTQPEIYAEWRERKRMQGRRYMSRPDVQLRHRAYQRSYAHIRRSRIRAVSGIHTPAQIQEQLKRQRYRCYYAACGYAKFEKKGGKHIFHIEHTFPISRVAGTGIPANDMSYLVLACPSCNQSKGNKFPWEFPEGGRLL